MARNNTLTLKTEHSKNCCFNIVTAHNIEILLPSARHLEEAWGAPMHKQQCWASRGTSAKWVQRGLEN